MLNILNNYMVNFLLSGFGFWYPRVHKFVLAIVTIIFHLICMALLSEFISSFFASYDAMNESIVGIEMCTGSCRP